MGNFLSGAPTEDAASTLHINTASESETMEDNSCLHDNYTSVIEEQFHDTLSDDSETRAKIKEEEMNEFRKELDIKREQRKEILGRHRAEKKALENALQNEIETKVELCESNQLLRELLIKNNIEVPENLRYNNEKSYIANSISHMREEIEKLRSSNIKLRCDLASSNSALQTAYTDIADLSAQNTESIKQVNALKEVISVSKTMIKLREQQLNELKNKLGEIEQSLADRETTMLSTDLRQEYERQLQNIRTLRGLYEERARLADVSRQALARDLDERKLLLEAEIKKSEDLTRKVDDLEAKLVTLEESVEDKNNIISKNREEIRRLQAEMLGINKLFSQALMGYQNKQNLDKLVHQLEENHGLLTHMAGKEDCPEVSTELPKLLLEIVNQIDEKDENNCNSTSIKEANTDNDSNKPDISKAEEIVQNLPKVWRVLMELLSHQSEAETDASKKVTTCYKSVETKSGPVLVPSVSQTYIRLKDLILEKLTLIKEMNRMKQLNTHLESRLEEQEKRLCLVTNELSKTWHVVGRLRRHHHQLHTHEKILKYELQQKRKLLNELKEELEYCREKWEQAREKNTQSEKDWRKLRTEFSNRKLKPETSLNNSAESGYSDERPSDSESNDESEYTEPKIKCKKKVKKSFDTIIDSSTDVNLAEREDPASDMLDIADLPLDTQDSAECILDSSSSDRLPKIESYEETEDEVGDMIKEVCVDEQSVIETIELTRHNQLETFNNRLLESNIDTVTNIDITTEETDSVNKDEKDESSSIDIFENCQVPKVNSTHCSLNQTITKNVQDNQDNNITTASSCTEVKNLENQSNENKNIGDVASSTDLTKEYVEEATAAQISEEKVVFDDEGQKEIDFAEILKNVKKQNEHLQLKDKRLENLESGCSSVVSNISNTLQLGEDMIEKLDTLHLKHESTDQNTDQHTIAELKQINLEEPSSSQDIDNEARFAAREIRLKRLEEQTKSLVNKVNKTASKGVKIHYKLEELHNIYGLENSRSGTPSEDTSDISQQDDDVKND